MEWLEEFDVYMRPVVRGLGHCRFKGESTSKTERNIPDQTAEEKELQDYLMQYAKKSGNLSQDALNIAATLSGKAFNPNWQDLYDDVLDRNDTALDEYRGYMDDELGTYKGAMSDALNRYNSVVDSQASKWNDLVNGVLPSAYAANRQAALRDDVNKLYGGTINNAAARGIINSSVTNKALDDAEQNLSDTLAKMYTSDLGTQASLLGQQGKYAQNRYDVNAGNAGNIYDRSKSYYDNLLGSTLGVNSSILGNAATAQTGSYEPVSNYLSYASTLAQPASNLFSTMYSGRMGTGSTTTTQSSGNNGVWSVMGALGTGLVCFTGETLISTPKGYKCIRDIREGDLVLSWKDGTVVEKQVSLVMEPREADIVEVYFDNGTVWHTTESQRYFDGRHFNYVMHSGKPAVVLNGAPAEIIRVVKPGRREKVYDFTVHGFAGENVYFANDVAAEGLGD